MVSFVCITVTILSRSPVRAASMMRARMRATGAGRRDTSVRTSETFWPERVPTRPYGLVAEVIGGKRTGGNGFGAATGGGGAGGATPAGPSCNGIMGAAGAGAGAAGAAEEGGVGAAGGGTAAGGMMVSVRTRFWAPGSLAASSVRTSASRMRRESIARH